MTWFAPTYVKNLSWWIRGNRWDWECPEAHLLPFEDYETPTNIVQQNYVIVSCMPSSSLSLLPLIAKTLILVSHWGMCMCVCIYLYIHMLLDQFGAYILTLVVLKHALFVLKPQSKIGFWQKLTKLVKYYMLISGPSLCYYLVQHVVQCSWTRS